MFASVLMFETYEPRHEKPYILYVKMQVQIGCISVQLDQHLLFAASMVQPLVFISNQPKLLH